MFLTSAEQSCVTISHSPKEKVMMLKMSGDHLGTTSLPYRWGNRSEEASLSFVHSHTTGVRHGNKNCDLLVQLSFQNSKLDLSSATLRPSKWSSSTVSSEDEQLFFSSLWNKWGWGPGCVTWHTASPLCVLAPSSLKQDCSTSPGCLQGGCRERIQVAIWTLPETDSYRDLLFTGMYFGFRFPTHLASSQFSIKD